MKVMSSLLLIVSISVSAYWLSLFHIFFLRLVSIINSKQDLTALLVQWGPFTIQQNTTTPSKCRLPDISTKCNIAEIIHIFNKVLQTLVLLPGNSSLTHRERWHEIHVVSTVILFPKFCCYWFCVSDLFSLFLIFHIFFSYCY